MEAMGYTVYSNLPEKFAPGIVAVFVDDLDFGYEGGHTGHLVTYVTIEWIEDDPRLIPSRTMQVIKTVESRLREEDVRSKGTFKFRKPQPIKLGLSTKVVLKCTYTEVFDL